jgi:hypothetical protein
VSALRLDKPVGTAGRVCCCEVSEPRNHWTDRRATSTSCPNVRDLGSVPLLGGVLSGRWAGTGAQVAVWAMVSGEAEV